MSEFLNRKVDRGPAGLDSCWI